MSLKTKHVYEFSEFRLDTVERVLLRGGEPVALAPKVFDTLLVLVENNGHIVGREELMNRVWADSFVEEGNLTYTISVLRKALADSSGESAFIETVPKRGYRFKAVVNRVEEVPSHIIVERHTIADIIIEETEAEIQTPQAESTIASEEKDMPIDLSASVASKSLRGKWIWAAGSLALLAVAFVGIWVLNRPQASSGLAVKSIAVLPFKSVGGTSDVVLELGMADALITNLSNARQIVVRPTSAVRRYVEESHTAVEAGRALQVDAVLEGSLQKQDDHIRVTLRLINVKDAQPLWGAKFDEKFTNIFALQDSIAEQVTRALRLQLTGDEKRLLAKRYTDNAEAYQAYLRGRFYWSKWNKASLEKAIESFEEALAIDKEYALAYAGISDSYGILGYLNFLSPRDAYPKSKEAALKALELDNTIGEAHSALAQTKLFYELDFAAAEKEMRRSVELSPNYANAHGLYGTYLSAMGRFNEALAERKRAFEIDPITPFTVNAVGWAYYYERKYDEAIKWYKKALELDPNFAVSRASLADVYYQKGMYTEAIDEYLKNKTLVGRSEEIESLRQAFLSSGVKGYWQKSLELEEERMKKGTRNFFAKARIYTELGNRDSAIDQLEKAFEERNSQVIFLKVAPHYASLRSEKRFQDLLERIGLGQ
jgi:DNA-binding winged helix-turn-helix (wHTH) protein/TolB-like protein/Tfp pilus assembly protein PilF